MEFEHKSVLLNECIEGLAIKPAGIYVDGTLGGAGHSYHIAQSLNDEGLLIGIDQDEAAILASQIRLQAFERRVKIVRSNYASFRKVLDDLEIDSVDGILLDLGVSSHQLDNAERGFSYMKDAPLDMRMDQRSEKTAATILNEYSDRELFHILKVYGEEKHASSIVKHIVKFREIKPIETTMELVEIIDRSIPAKVRRAMTGHPAKKTFQAIRIELNEELEVLKNTLDEMIAALKPDGRLCIITFHSLEDRIVKQSYREHEDPCVCPRNFPACVCGKESQGKAIPRKPVLPSTEELEINSRSKSAKLRIFVKGAGEENGKSST